MAGLDGERREIHMNPATLLYFLEKLKTVDLTQEQADSLIDLVVTRIRKPPTVINHPTLSRPLLRHQWEVDSLDKANRDQ